ncbi:MAG: RHS repeat protein [Chitinispirillaceae bacterium]|nr:RHS repeat protein [Chitinispirillaceae bacterium]
MHYLIKDPLYQIIEATSPKVQRTLEQFDYDSVGNWTGGGRVHNELNQLTEDDSSMYSYDADGNMTEKVSKATGDTTHFVWDIENKLTEVRKPGTVVRYVYDALGRRVSKEVNGGVTQFRYDGEDLILEMNAEDSITANYTFGPGIDNPLQMHRDGRNLYYVKDGLGSVTALTDSAGSVVHEYAYSVFGEIIEESGDVVENPFTYTSREWEPEVGLYYYRARYYDARIGRFLSEDPIGYFPILMFLNKGLVEQVMQNYKFIDNRNLLSVVPGTNMYCYVVNSSVLFIDPYGLVLEMTPLGYGGALVMGISAPFIGTGPGAIAFGVGAAMVITDLVMSVEWAKKTGEEIGEPMNKAIDEQKKIIDDLLGKNKNDSGKTGDPCE